jgi:uncharacterized protein YjiS (DUF1127 family)
MDHMDSRITPAEAALLMPRATPARPSEAADIAAAIAEARRVRDEALFARVGAFFTAIAEGLTALRRRGQTIAELRALSDRELNDIGVRRGNIAEVAASALPEAANANDAAGTRRAA